jgi:antitoxin ParD1/3/4
MARQSTLNVSLTPTLQRYVRTKLKRGGYESASEVIRDGLRALQQRDTASAFWADVRDKVSVARDEISKGKVVDGDAAMNAIISELGELVPSRRKKRSA